MQRQTNDIFFLDVTGNTHIIIGKSGGYIVMGMGKKKKCPCWRLLAGCFPFADWKIFWWAALKSFKNNSAACEKNFRLWDKNHAPFKLNGKSRTVFGLLKAPELQRLSVTVEVLRVGVMIVGVISVVVMTVGVLSVGVMTLSHPFLDNLITNLKHVSLNRKTASVPCCRKIHWWSCCYNIRGISGWHLFVIRGFQERSSQMVNPLGHY